MNRQFPYWVTADAMIKHIADEYLEAYVTTNKSNSTEVVISFLPDITELIPEADRARFDNLYGKFVTWAADVLNLTELFEKWYYSVNTSEMRDKFAIQINSKIKEYNENHFVGFEDEFLHIMGVI